jgi:hypothetical protein
VSAAREPESAPTSGAGSQDPAPGARIELVYYTDPLCCWCWAFEPHWRRLRAEVGSALDWPYRLAGMIGAFVWGSLVRIMLLHHVTWSINSICHFYGKEAYQARDESKNVWPISALSFGESWHNNHHAFPWSARLGLRPWQVDPG